MEAFYVLAWITAPDYYFTIALVRKNLCKIVNNTIIWKKNAMVTKMVLKLSFDKLYIVCIC